MHGDVLILERESATPLYQQLEDILYRRLTSGEWDVGARIPSENELHKSYGLSRMTIRGVLSKLTADGLLIRVPGKGTYVAPKKISAVSPAYRGVREQLENLGYAATTRLLSHQVGYVAPAVREHLGIGIDEKVHAIVRLRYADGNPVSLHRSYVPEKLAPGLEQHDVVAEQLCVVLENSYGLPMCSVTESLEATIPDEEDARLLCTDLGEVVLRLSDTIRDQNGVVFEHSSVLFRGDKIKLRFDYQL